MTPRDLIGTAGLAALGIAGGAAIGTTALVVLGIVGAALGVLVSRLGIRWAVAYPVIIGTAAGALLGWAVTHAFCRPQGCPATEVAAGVLTGIGALVGVGIVVALAARSFDEYRDTRTRPPS